MKKKLIISVIAILIIVAFAMRGCKQKVPTSSDIYTVLLNSADITTVKLTDVDSMISFTGELSPLNQSVISSEVDAAVKKVLVQEGQLVTKGQVLAVLDDTDYKQAVSQQQAILSSAKVKFLLDKNKLEKQQALYDQGFISKIAYDELQTNYQASQQVINQQQAALERAKKQLADTIIKAPFTGYIYQKNIDNGQLATKNSKLFSLASLDYLQVKAPIPSDYINHVSVGQTISFSVETKPNIFSGKISRINPVAELGTRSYFIYADFDNTKAALKAGQFIKGNIVLTTLKNTPALTRDAIRGSDDNTYVLVLEKNLVVQKAVKILLTNKLANIVAISGLNPGEIVLLSTVLSVKAGDHAKIVD